MKVFVAGATGATGRLLVRQLLERGIDVVAVARSPEKLSNITVNRERLSIIEAAILDLSDEEMGRHLSGCDAVVSCLGHTLSFRGIYGGPRRLVTESVRRLCGAIRINKPDKPVQFILMNTSGNRDRDQKERWKTGEKIVNGLLFFLLPPHRDNIAAAEYLRTNVGQKDPYIHWIAVRPDTLVNEDEVTEYQVCPSPVRSPIFNAGKTSRINVGCFMADLFTDATLWERWRGRMPILYNRFDANPDGFQNQ